MERARQCLLRVYNLYGHITLRSGDTEDTAREFLDQTLDLFSQERSGHVARAKLSAVIAKSASHKTMRTDYATAADARLAVAVRTVEASSTA